MINSLFILFFDFENSFRRFVLEAEIINGEVRKVEDHRGNAIEPDDWIILFPINKVHYCVTLSGTSEDFLSE